MYKKMSESEVLFTSYLHFLQLHLLRSRQAPESPQIERSPNECLPNATAQIRAMEFFFVKMQFSRLEIAI
jgi:hypothetical protein